MTMALFKLNKAETKYYAQMQQKTSLKMIKTTIGIRRKKK